jgi:hypothetical protein
MPSAEEIKSIAEEGFIYGLPIVMNPLYPEGLARRGKGSELAARAGRSDLLGDAALLAEKRTAFDPAARRWHVESAAGRAGEIGRLTGAGQLA